MQCGPRLCSIFSTRTGVRRVVQHRERKDVVWPFTYSFTSCVGDNDQLTVLRISSSRDPHRILRANSSVRLLAQPDQYGSSPQARRCPRLQARQGQKQGTFASHVGRTAEEVLKDVGSLDEQVAGGPGLAQTEWRSFPGQMLMRETGTHPDVVQLVCSSRA